MCVCVSVKVYYQQLVANHNKWLYSITNTSILNCLYSIKVLSCLTEETSIHKERKEMEKVPVGSNHKDGDPVNSNDRDIFVEIGTTILTARSCDSVDCGKLVFAEEESRDHSRPVSFQECEIFRPIQPQVRSNMCFLFHY